MTNPNSDPLLPQEFFESDPKTAASGLTSGVSSAVSALVNLAVSPAPKQAAPVGTHSLAIVARMLEDNRLAPDQGCAQTSERKFLDTIKNRGDVIREYANQWVVPLDAKGIEAKIEELSWLAAILFGLGGFRENKGFRADFFLFVPRFHKNRQIANVHISLLGYTY